MERNPKWRILLDIYPLPEFLILISTVSGDFREGGYGGGRGSILSHLSKFDLVFITKKKVVTTLFSYSFHQFISRTAEVIITENCKPTRVMDELRDQTLPPSSHQDKTPEWVRMRREQKGKACPGAPTGSRRMLSRANLGLD